MKHIVTILLVLSILTSCISTPNDSLGNEKIQVENFILNDSLKKILDKKIEGVWVLTNYIYSIEQTKSPVKSADKLHHLVTLVISPFGDSDCITIGASLNNHEGYSFTAYSKIGQNNNSISTNLIDYDNQSNFYELGYEIIGSQNFLFIYHYDKNKKLINKSKFTKVAINQTEENVAWGLQYIVNQKLFSGNYILLDSTNSLSKVTLSDDGKITGISNFKTYEVITDYMGGPEGRLDAICFDLEDTHSKCYSYVILEDTTYIYKKNIINEETEEEELGQLIYKLVKKN